jgi:hypothetical protein
MKARNILRPLGIVALFGVLMGHRPVGAAEVSGCLSEFPDSNCGIVQATVELQPLGETADNSEFFSFEDVAPGSYLLRVDPPCVLFGCWVPVAIDVAEENIFVRIPMQTSCVGDCNNDCLISIDELVRGVGIFLGEQTLAACPPFDHDFSGSLTVEELATSVTFGLGGCPYRSPSCLYRKSESRQSPRSPLRASVPLW